MSLLEECRAALDSRNVQAFLRVIRAGESSQDGSAYKMIVGGGLFDSYDDHPRKLVAIASLGVSSTAAGAYQFLSRTWDECAAALSLPDFSPPMQDLAAVFLIRRRGALLDLLAGRIEVAIAKCAKEWASLPGSPYGQPTRSMEQALATYAAYGGTTEPVKGQIQPEIEEIRTSFPAGEAGPPEQPMPLPAIVGALLPTLIESIPKLGKLFGSGSAVAERNVKAAELAMTIAKDAVGAVNAQEAIEKIKADPTAAAAATAAIEQRWFELAESGGGGIDGARKADAAFSGGDIKHSPSFWVTMALLPLVYMIVGSVVGWWGKEWPNDVRASLATAIVSLIIGGAAGYYWGQTTSRNRSPAP